jgi:hypothetical protein
MRTFGNIVYGFMALVLGAGWAFLFWQSSTVNLPAVEASRASLTELRAIDAGWNQRLVSARLNAGFAPDITHIVRCQYPLPWLDPVAKPLTPLVVWGTAL